MYIHTCVYIYIYIHILKQTSLYESMLWRLWNHPRAGRSKPIRKGTNGVSTNGVTVNFVFFEQRDLLGTPVNILLFSQKCQGLPFSPTRQHLLLLQRPY